MAHVVLGLLLLMPQTIYSLNKHFEQAISLFYRASLGGLRSALTGLLARGEVEFEISVERGRTKKTYYPTDAGRAAFYAWLKEPVTSSDIETAAASKLFFLGMLEAPAERRAVLDDLLECFEHEGAVFRELEAQLDAVDVDERDALVFRYQRATLTLGISANSAAVEHLSTLRAEL